MPHHSPLVATIVIGLVLAFILGAIANRFRISPLVGYILAGVIVGPHTPGFVADQSLALELAEIGVILLMFGVGLHFSPKDLLAVKAIAIPGAVVQIAIATLLGTVMPGGPLIAFPIVVILTKAGAGMPALVTFLTSWSVLGIQRILGFELPMMGSKFVINRVAIGIFLPAISGGLVYLLDFVL